MACSVFWTASLGLFLGQLLSLIITSTSIITCELSQPSHRLQVPYLQTLLTYGLLAVVYLPVLLLRGRRQPLPRLCDKRSLLYILGSACDVAATALLLVSYKRLLLPVIALLSTLTTPTAMLISRFLLGSTFDKRQYLGAAICMIGVTSYVMFKSREDGFSGSWIGVVQCLGGAVVYALSNVLQELLVEAHGSIVYLAWNGLAGVIWSTLALAILGTGEVGMFVQAGFTSKLLILLYMFLIFSFYSLMPVFLSIASATFFNLSLLSVNIYILIASVLFYNMHLDWYYGVSLIVILAGLILYGMVPQAKPGGIDNSRMSELQI